MSKFYMKFLKKHILKKENKIKELKGIDEVLSKVTYNDLTCTSDSNSKRVQNHLKKVEKKLLKLKNAHSKRVNQTSLEDKTAKKLLDKFNFVLEKSIYKIKVKNAYLKHQVKVSSDKLWWQEMPKEEKKERRSDLSFYRPDKLGYSLTLLSVVAELTYLIMLLSIMVRSFWIGITILTNIVFLLLLFTIAIKVKNYKKTYAYWSFGFGVYCIIRISWIITGLMGVDLVSATAMKQGFIWGCNIYIILASFAVGIQSLMKIKHQEIYLKEEKISNIQLSK